MKKFLSLFFVFMLALAPLALVPACQQPSTADQEQVFCQSLQKLASSAAQVRAINITTGVDEAKSRAQDLRNAWSDVVNARKNLAVARFNDLQTAYDQVQFALNTLQGTQSVRESLPAISNAVTTFDSTLSEIRFTVCKITPTSAP
jgi:hypothetical protein